MDLKLTFQNDMKAAMKAQDTVKVSALRMLISEIKKKEIDKKAPLEVAEIQKTIHSMIKQRQDSVTAFTEGNRPELAEQETKEIEILKVYLPTALSDEELKQIVQDSVKEAGTVTAADLGKVMKIVLSKTQGRADGKRVNELVRQALSPS